MKRSAPAGAPGLAQREAPDLAQDLTTRLGAVDWAAIERSLWEIGSARLPRLLTPAECDTLVGLYEDEAAFRKRVEMERHRFGVGEYKYFAAPLPPLVQALRTHAYPPLSGIANNWQKALDGGGRGVTAYPRSLSQFLGRCKSAGQTKPTPLMLRYDTGGFNCLHQDLYGEIAFPLQMTILLSRRGIDFDGGEMLFIEQRPREQSRGTAVTLDQGEGVIFTTRYRPVLGNRGFRRFAMRHGVSRVTAGRRFTLGIIFHDAK
jgi:hypothetical protein